MSQRNRELLRKAAREFDRSCNPFENWWLVENHVTADECIDLSHNIAAGARLLLQTMRDMDPHNPVVVRQVAVDRLGTALSDPEAW